jgi:hypothetical protein
MQPTHDQAERHEEPAAQTTEDQAASPAVANGKKKKRSATERGSSSGKVAELLRKYGLHTESVERVARALIRSTSDRVEPEPKDEPEAMARKEQH